MAIFFHEESIKSGLNNKRIIKLWIKSVLELENKKTGAINIIFTTDQKLCEINQRFLSRDYYTDIITFDYSKGRLISGDLFISMERVRENARKFGFVLEVELRRVMIHGILHLVGYNDRQRDEEKEMRNLEDTYLGLFSETY